MEMLDRETFADVSLLRSQMERKRIELSYIIVYYSFENKL